MNDTKNIGRRSLLKSSLGTLGGVMLGACTSGGDEGETGGTTSSSAPGNGGAPSDATPSGTSTDAMASPTSSASATPSASETPDVSASASTTDMQPDPSATATSTDAAGGSGGSGGSGLGGDSSGGMGGENGGMGGTSPGGSGGGGMGGASGGSADMDGGVEGGGVICNAVVAMVNDHTHQLTVPGSDVERSFQEAPYILEDGGTGHTHTLQLTGYDFLYLQAGATQMVTSSVDAEHSHTCAVTCALG